jgi:hypothetical protein
VLTDIERREPAVRVAHWSKVAGLVIPASQSFNFNEAVMLFARKGCCGDARGPFPVDEIVFTACLTVLSRCITVGQIGRRFHGSDRGVTMTTARDLVTGPSHNTAFSAEG